MTTAIDLPLQALFAVANTTALASWCALVALPRTALLRSALLTVGVGGPCLLYAVLIQLFFFGVPGGGFATLASVQALFGSREVALAGWVHYLAFDLFIGIWIAQRCDGEGISRWLQAPVLATTFMFGPIGLLLACTVLTTRRWGGSGLAGRMGRSDPDGMSATAQGSK